MKLEDLPDTGVVFDPLDDVSLRRKATPLEREVIDLLELDVGHRDSWVRLSRTWWRRVDAVVDRIVSVPTPRLPSDVATEVPR